MAQIWKVYVANAVDNIYIYMYVQKPLSGFQHT
jgi:hypothetical protein